MRSLLKLLLVLGVYCLLPIAAAHSVGPCAVCSHDAPELDPTVVGGGVTLAVVAGLFLLERFRRSR